MRHCNCDIRNKDIYFLREYISFFLQEYFPYVRGINDIYLTNKRYGTWFITILIIRICCFRRYAYIIIYPLLCFLLNLRHGLLKYGDIICNILIISQWWNFQELFLCVTYGTWFWPPPPSRRPPAAARASAADTSVDSVVCEATSDERCRYARRRAWGLTRASEPIFSQDSAPDDTTHRPPSAVIIEKL